MVSSARYIVTVTKRARKELAALPRKAREHIEKTIDSLELHPRPEGCKKLKGSSDLWRVAAGEYRILYIIEDRIVLITVVRIADRKDAYRNL